MRVLVIAAHPDDEVLGPGATLAKMKKNGAELHVAIVTEGSTTQYPDRPDLVEAKRVAARRALDALGGGTIHFGELPDMKLDTLPLVQVNAFLERVVREVKPNVVFTHHGADLNRDHRIVHEASLVACRPSTSHVISELLAYEILGVTDFAGTQASFVPRLYVECAAFMEAKTKALTAYDVELRPFPHPRSHQAIDAHGRVRGAQSGNPWAEAFEVLRMTR